MSGGKNRFDLNQVQDDSEEIVVPRTQLVARSATEEPTQKKDVSTIEQGREVAVQDLTNKAHLLAEQRFKPVSEKRATSVRFEPWLDDALNRRVYELRIEGYRKMTREAVITDAVMQYLGIKPPEE